MSDEKISVPNVVIDVDDDQQDDENLALNPKQADLLKRIRSIHTAALLEEARLPPPRPPDDVESVFSDRKGDLPAQKTARRAMAPVRPAPQIGPTPHIFIPSEEKKVLFDPLAHLQSQNLQDLLRPPIPKDIVEPIKFEGAKLVSIFGLDVKRGQTHVWYVVSVLFGVFCQVVVLVWALNSSGMLTLR